jgi:hypothetical protein
MDRCGIYVKGEVPVYQLVSALTMESLMPRTRSPVTCNSAVFAECRF